MRVTPDSIREKVKEALAEDDDTSFNELVVMVNDSLENLASRGFRAIRFEFEGDAPANVAKTVRLPKTNDVVRQQLYEYYRDMGFKIQQQGLSFMIFTY